MAVDTETKEAKTPLEVVVDDYATETVPMKARLPTRSLLVIFLGMAASSYFLLLGGLVVYTVGFARGLTAMVFSTVLNAIFAVLGAYIGFREGLTSDLSSRFYGFGKIGSIITSGIYASIFIGFISIETGILEQSISMFVPFSKPATYIILSLLWISFVVFGVRQVSLLNKIALPLFIATFALTLAYSGKQLSLGSAFSFEGGLIPGDITTAINIGLSTLGLSFFVADYTRFAKTPRGAIIAALGYAIPCFLIMPLIGALMSIEFGTVMPGVYFVAAGGIIGVVAMVLSQMKIQAINSYSASLALSNLGEMSTNSRPGRLFWVITANIIGAGLLFLNFLEQLPLFIEIAGVLSTAWASVLLADYYIVRGTLHLMPKKIVNVKMIPSVNIIGVLSMAVSALSSLLLRTIFPIPALSAILIGVSLYVLASLARGRMYTNRIPQK